MIFLTCRFFVIHKFLHSSILALILSTSSVELQGSPAPQSGKPYSFVQFKSLSSSFSLKILMPEFRC